MLGLANMSRTWDLVWNNPKLDGHDTCLALDFTLVAGKVLNQLL